MYLERDLDDSPNRLLTWLEDGGTGGPVASVFRPPLDVIETAEAIEIVVDVPGVAADAIRVVITNGTLVISGYKRSPRCENRQTAFHLAERTFGQFGCALRLSMAIDAGRTRAILKA